MGKKIAKIFGFLCTLGVILLIISNFLPEDYAYIPWGIGVIILWFSVIPYLCAGEKTSELFYKILDFLQELDYVGIYCRVFS